MYYYGIMVFDHIISGVHNELNLCGGSRHPGHFYLLRSQANIYNIDIVKIL